MMAVGYEVEKISSKENLKWTTFIEDSPQYTPFIRDDFLQAVGFESDKYLVYRKGQPVVGICLPISSTGEQIAVPYAPYQGLLYRPVMDSYASYKEHMEAVSILLLFLDGKYNKIFFRNHYTVNDIRAVLWHHYHTPEQGQYQINVKYTATKDLTKDFLVGMSKGRNLDYRYSRNRHHLMIGNNSDSEMISCFLDLYRKTFERENIILPQYDMQRVCRIMRTALSNGYGMMRTAYLESGEIVDSIFVIYDINNAYYLFSANHPDYRKYGGGTLLLVETMKVLQNRGIKEFDFVGVNSPLRGDFKLSFGSTLRAYYVCTYSKRCSDG